MAKYKARHLCRGHKWSEYHSWYDAYAGRFERFYRCLRCGELKSTVIPHRRTEEEPWN